MPELNSDQLFYFLFFGVPGFVALKVYELFVPGRKTSAQILDVISYGMLNLVVASPILWLADSLEGRHSGVSHALATGALAAVAVVLSPAALAYSVYRLRMHPRISRWILHPMSSAWDFLFQQHREWFLILHLRDGKMVGGRYGENSFASDAIGSGDGGPDLYVEETWLLDEQGRFIEKRPASILVQRSECKQIEFFEVREQGEEKEADDAKGQRRRKNARKSTNTEQ